MMMMMMMMKLAAVSQNGESLSDSWRRRTDIS